MSPRYAALLSHVTYNQRVTVSESLQVDHSFKLSATCSLCWLSGICFLDAQTNMMMFIYAVTPVRSLSGGLRSASLVLNLLPFTLSEF